MFLIGVSLYRVKMPLLEPWVTAYGSQKHIESLFINMRFENCEGWGECSPAPQPLYNSEYTAGAFNLSRDVLAPIIIGKNISSGLELQDMFQHIKGNEFAKSAFDCAWWDAYSRLLQKPLWQIIGGEKPLVSVGADIPVQPDAKDLIKRVAEVVTQGFTRVKLKFSRNSNFKIIEAVREAYPELEMHIDCNSGFTLDDLDLFLLLDKLNLKMIEQPLGYDDLIFHSKLQEKINTPICLDESITSISRARKAIEIGACGWINIKTSRVGGLTNALAIHDLCEIYKMPVWVGGMLESAVGQGASLALATKRNVLYPSDIFPSNRFFKEDFSEPEIKLKEGAKIFAPLCPGSGFTPKVESIRKGFIEQAQLKLE